MIQFSKIWGVSLPRVPRVACVALFAVTSAHAQFGGSGGGFGGGFTPLPPGTPAPLVTTADIQWSKSASASYQLNMFTGSYFDAKVLAQVTSPSGRVTPFTQYVKNLTPNGYTFDSKGALTGGSFANELTWNAPEYADTQVSGGSFTLSKLRWEFMPGGAARVLATASGTWTEATPLTVWETSSPAVSVSSNQVSFNQLALTSEALSAMANAFGADPTGVGYLSLRMPSFGVMRIQGIPELATWAQMSIGLVGLGFLARRRIAR
jgi:hypothetical protein